MRGEGRSNEGLSTAPSSSLLMSPSTAPLARIDLERGTRPQNMHGVAHPAHPAESLLVCVLADWHGVKTNYQGLFVTSQKLSTML